MSNPSKKVIKTAPNELKENLLIENDFLISYFQREDVIKLLTRENITRALVRVIKVE